MIDQTYVSWESPGIVTRDLEVRVKISKETSGSLSLSLGITVETERGSRKRKVGGREYD